MPVSTVLNIHAHDRPGIMSRVSNVIKQHGGNWMESRMARLAGQFAGIVRVETDADTLPALNAALTNLAEEGIHVHVLDEVICRITLTPAACASIFLAMTAREL